MLDAFFPIALTNVVENWKMPPPSKKKGGKIWFTIRDQITIHMEMKIGEEGKG